MAEVLGPMQVVQQALPTGIDGLKITEWNLRDGTNMGALLSQLGAALGAFNTGMVARWGGLFSITDDIFMEYADGGAVTALQQITDIDLVDMVHGSTIGHMIPLNAYGGAVGGSRHFFRDARTAQILSTIRTIVRKAEWRFEKELLGRFFDSDDVAIGSAGYSVPFVHSTGGAVDYTPPSYGGEAFANTHDHFVFNNSGYAELLNVMAETLQEHGHIAPFDVMVSRADYASYTALTNWVQLTSPIIQTIDRAAETSGPRFFANGQVDVAGSGLIGYFQSDYGQLNVYSSARIPTTYAGMYKNYGQLDARNSLAVRVHPAEGFGAKIIPVPSHQEGYPVQRLDIEFEFGVGVGGDRTNGVVGIKAASYTGDPTIS